MENNVEKFKNTLKTIFQIDRADLDFGIYRILNQKHDEITKFLDADLLPQVKKELAAYEAGDQAELTRELEEKIAKFRADGFTDDQINANEKVAELRDKLKTADRVNEIESEVFTHLLRFFERYYEEGDFISKRRYKDGVYAIPYEGEEVKLYWANHDQYYIKTSERFKDFSFKIGDKSIHFKIREAETDANNNKNISGKDRRFVLCKEDFWQERDGVLDIFFEYVSVDGKKKQEECSKEAIETVLVAVPSEWQSILTTPAPTEKQKDRTTLEKFLTSYTARNTFDYFIHKDLGTFLTRELDFYIKNEVMFLDDIENETAPRADQYLAKVKVIRSIAKKIIRMLAQLEDFQKKLWEKKKFVVGTGYCITLDLVPERFYNAVLASDAQRAEWKQLGFIDDTTELNHDYLKAHPTLSIDTKFFPEWRDELLGEFENLDERVNGVMINSENFGALNVLQERYKEQVKAIYIDPPYNTSASEILYKNNYRHSSWLSLMSDRILTSSSLMNKEAILCVTIDDAEFNNLYGQLVNIFGKENIAAVVPIRINPSGRPTEWDFALTHEYAIFVRISNIGKIHKIARTEKQLQRFNELDEKGIFEFRNLRREGSNSDRIDGQRQYFPIYANLDAGTIRLPKMTWLESKRAWDVNEEHFENEVVIYPVNEHGREKNWRWSIESIKEDYGQFIARVPRDGTPRVYYKYRPSSDGTTPLTMWVDAKFSATEHGTNLIKDLFGYSVFSYPKSIFAVQECLHVSGHTRNTLVVDFFAGSGTVGHATLKLNHEDNQKEPGSGQRKYILVEMGAYFDTVTKPRMQKVVYSDEWSASKPQDDGASGAREHIIKYFKLESYEDTLNNLEMVRTPQQQSVLEANKNFREDYTLAYMLDVEAKASVLRLESFRNPFTYTIKLSTDVVGETRDTPVDLVETFNYLIGLKVATIQRHGEHLLVVEGATRAGEKILVIWRNQDVVDNAGLDDFFKKQALSTTDFEFDRIYVNGDNNLENLKADGDQWKVVTIEEEFHKRMFA